MHKPVLRAHLADFKILVSLLKGLAIPTSVIQSRKSLQHFHSS